jgi:hypothetical protein
MQMVMLTRENGWMIKLMGMVFTTIQMELDMRVDGKKIYKLVLFILTFKSMDKEKKFGQMGLITKEITLLERNMDKEPLNGLMELFIKDNLIIITLKVKLNSYLYI